MTPTNTLKTLYDKIPENVKKAIFYSIVFGILCHFYMLTNKLTNHDDLEQLVNIMDLRSSGRWFLHFATLISTYLSMPWVNGVLVIIYLSISAGIIVDMFNIKSKIYILLVCAIIMSFPTIMALLPYMQSADGYFLACLFSVLASYLLIKHQYGYIYFIVLNVLSLATYQIFLGYSITLVIMYYLIKTVFEDYDVKKLLRHLLLTGILSVLVVIIYYIFTKYIVPGQLSNYQGVSNMGSIKISRFPIYIANTYWNFIRFFFIDIFHQFGYLKYVNLLLFVVAAAIFMYSLIRTTNDKWERAFIIAIYLLLPIPIYILNIMAPLSTVALRMAYPSVSIYIFFLVAAERFNKYLDHGMIKKTYKTISIVGLWTIILISIATSYKFVLSSNQVYFALDINSKNLESYTTRLLTRIEEKDFYSKDKRVIILGRQDIRTDFTEKYYTDTVQASLLLRKMIPGIKHWRLYPERYAAFSNKIDILYIKEAQDRLSSDLLDIIDSKPLYPHKDSIFEYNGSIYVKIEDMTTNQNR